MAVQASAICLRGARVTTYARRPNATTNQPPTRILRTMSHDITRDRLPAVPTRVSDREPLAREARHRDENPTRGCQGLPGMTVGPRYLLLARHMKWCRDVTHGERSVEASVRSRWGPPMNAFVEAAARLDGIAPGITRLATVTVTRASASADRGLARSESAPMTITANTFVDAAAQVCATAAELGMGAAMMLHRTSGPRRSWSTTYLSATDDVRRWIVTEDAWRINPMMVELRRQLGLLGPEVFDVPAYTRSSQKGYRYGGTKHVGIPMIGPGGGSGRSRTPWSGAERLCRTPARHARDRALRWCTARGIATIPEVRPLAGASTRSPRSPQAAARIPRSPTSSGSRSTRQAAAQAGVRAARRRQPHRARERASPARAARRHSARHLASRRCNDHEGAVRQNARRIPDRVLDTRARIRNWCL